MRPVNLIPSDERRGQQAPLRRGRISYGMVGGLLALLAAVVAVVLTNRQVAQRETELAGLQQREQDADAKLQRLQAFASLRSVTDQRVATVTSLAQSRFDWERVMTELSRILPSDVWLINLTGTVRPGVQLDDAAAIPTRESVEAPALEIIGCADSQDAVARFVSDVKDIDGVTRVGVFDSKRPDPESGAPGGSAAATGAGGGSADCRTKDTETRFQLVVAFDGVPTPQIPQAAPTPGTTPAPGGGQTPPTPPSPQSSGGVQAQPVAAPNSQQAQIEKARKATNLVPK